MKLIEEQYNILKSFAFKNNYPGYRPQVIESPNGDNVWDEHKKYSHVAPKYLKQVQDDEYGLKTDVMLIYSQCLNEAANVCEALGIPKEFGPGYDSTLRVLQYPPGATTAPHTDFNLFTLCMYRTDMDAFKYLDGENDLLLNKARKISPGIHFGEIMTEINNAQATEHEVVGTDNWQYSAVFFVVPDHNAVLPSGISVGEWMDERKNRARKIV